MTTHLIKYNDYEIEVHEYNNNKKDTLVFIHGLFSSYKFVHDLPKLKNNFNIILFSFPGNLDNKFRAEDYVEVTTMIIKSVKHSKVHIVGHSFGGYISSRVGQMSKVKSVTLVAPVNPFMIKSRLYKRLEDALGQENKGKFKAKLLRSGAMAIDVFASLGISKFVSKKNVWSDVIEKDLLNKQLIVNELSSNYNKIAKKISFVVGDKDMLIEEDLLAEYARTLNKEALIIHGAAHNPFSFENVMHQYLNDKCPSRAKRIKVRTIFKP